MKVVHEGNENYVLRFDPGDEVIGGIKDFCDQKKITGGFLWGIGSCQGLTLSYYDLEAKKYQDTELEERLEIASLLGNVAQHRGETIVHAHGVFGDRATQARVGHVKKLVVSATGEIHLRMFEGELSRQSDPETGLNLLA